MEFIKENWTKLLGVGLVIAVVAFLYFNSKKEDSKDKEEKEYDFSDDEKDFDTGSSGTDSGTDDSDFDTGTKDKDEDLVKDNTAIVYDINTSEGKQILKEAMNNIESNPSQMYAIKKELKIGSKLWEGVEDDNTMFTSDGRTASIGNDIKRFYKDKMAIGIDPTFDWYDVGTSAVFTEGQKPQLRSDLKRISDYKDSNPTQAALSFYDVTNFRLKDFGDDSPFFYQSGANGSYFRRHELRVLNNMATWARNYVAEMDRLGQRVRSAAIATLANKNIKFKGINA